MSNYYLLVAGYAIAKFDDYFDALSAYIEYADTYEDVKMVVELSENSKENE